MSISVVVASFSSEAALGRCLESVEAAADRLPPAEGRPEVLVARADRPQRLADRHPGVAWIAAPAGASVFELRRRGAEAARGALVAFLEDHVTVAPEWLEALRSAHAEGRAAVGGPVENGRRGSACGWALYLAEYGLHMPPVPAGPAASLSGLNVAYDRRALEATRELWRRELRENELHDALRAGGESLWRVPAAGVSTRLEMGFAEAAAHLYAGGRHYGRYRRARSGALGRLWPLVAPLVPWLLVARLARTIAARRPRRLVAFLWALPATLALLSAWALGEAVGAA